MEKEEDHITLLLPEAIEKLQRVLMWEFSLTEELRRRKEIVEWMNNNNIRDFRGVANFVAKYMEAPVETLKEIKKVVKQ